MAHYQTERLAHTETRTSKRAMETMSEAGPAEELPQRGAAALSAGTGEPPVHQHHLRCHQLSALVGGSRPNVHASKRASSKRRQASLRRQNLQLGELGGAIAQRKIGEERPGPMRSSTFSNLFRWSTRPAGGASRPASPAKGRESMAALLAARRRSKPWYIVDPRRSHDAHGTCSPRSASLRHRHAVRGRVPEDAADVRGHHRPALRGIA